MREMITRIADVSPKISCHTSPIFRSPVTFLFKKISRSVIKKKSRVILYRDFERLVDSDYVWSKGFASAADYCGGVWHVVSSTERLLSRRHYQLLARKVSDYHVFWIKAGSHARRKSLDNLSLFTEEVLPKITSPFTLVTTDGDASAIELIENSGGDEILKSPYLKCWFAQNAQSSASLKGSLDRGLVEAYQWKVVPLPIGLDLHTERGSGVGIRLLASLIKEAGRSFSREPKILVDCCLNQSSKERINFCRTLKNVSEVMVLDRRLSQLELWRLYSQSVAVLSLPGHGLDCHRTWEALYFGAVPIVLDVGFGSLYQSAGAPIVEIPNIDSLCWEDLLAHAIELSQSAQDLRFLKKSNWIGEMDVER